MIVGAGCGNPRSIEKNIRKSRLEVTGMG